MMLVAATKKLYWYLLCALAGRQHWDLAIVGLQKFRTQRGQVANEWRASRRLDKRSHVAYSSTRRKSVLA